MTMPETTGRKSLQPRRTAIGGRVMGCDLLTIRVDLD
jgi:hypothetical protein